MRDICFKTFSIQNFLSIGNEPVQINFTPGLHLITGLNKDKDGRRNGVGKSTIMDAIHWVLFGSALRDISKSTIANFNTKGSCTGTMEFNITLNGKTSAYKVVRVLSPSKLHLEIDGEDKTLSTMPATTQLLEKLLGFTSTLFKNSVILSINNSQAFLAQEKIVKRKFIEGIFNLEVFSSILLDVRKRSEETKKLIDIANIKVDAKKQNVNVYIAQRDLFDQEKTKNLKELSGTLERYKTQLTTTQSKLTDVSPITEKQSELRAKKKAIEEQISTTTKQIESENSTLLTSSSLLINVEKETEHYIKNVKIEADRKIENLNNEKSHIIKDVKIQIDTKVALIEKERDFYLKDIENQKNLKLVIINKEKNDYIKSTQATECPTCKRPLKEKIELDQIKVNEYDKQISEVNAAKPDSIKLDVFDKQILEARNLKPDQLKIESIDKLIAELHMAKPEPLKLEIFSKEVIRLKSVIDGHRTKIEGFKQLIFKLQNEGISKINEALEKFQAIITKNDQVKVEVEFCNRQVLQASKQYEDAEKSKNTFVDLLDTAKKELDVLIEEQKSLQKLHKIYESAKYIVSEEGVKTYIIKNLLSVLNDRIDYYLRKLDSNSTCVFNEFFEETIKNDKGVECSYFNFSGAEMKTIDLACLFAFMDIRRMQGDVAINISMYDELFDSSFDEKGLEHVVDILKERVNLNNEVVFVISHRKESLKAATGEVIMLEKQNGVTRRVKNA